MNQPTVIVIVGPTAVGKTSAAIQLAQNLHTEIISADSRQCFTELNIGVAKPTQEELRAVHHYFINAFSIHQEVNAALFEELALQWTDDIFRRQTTAGTSGYSTPAPVLPKGTSGQLTAAPVTARPTALAASAPSAPAAPSSSSTSAPSAPATSASSESATSTSTSGHSTPAPGSANDASSQTAGPSAPDQATAASAPSALAIPTAPAASSITSAAPGSPTAIMVGGTGFYIKAFCEGLDAIPAIRPGIREEVLAIYETAGIEGLRQMIKSEDPAFYTEGEIHNPQRLMRALEVVRSTGHSIFSFRNRSKKQRPFHILKIGLHLPKELLHQRIHDRVDQMMEQGLLQEVKSLLPYKENNALQTVGYRELFDYLDGKCTLSTAIDEIKKNTRHYAKRQMTWFRKDPSIQWIDARDFVRDPLAFVPQP